MLARLEESVRDIPNSSIGEGLNREASERETGVHDTKRNAREREREREREIRKIIFFFLVITFVWLVRKFEGKCLGE